MNYCSMCGSTIPNGQRTCSMCYGDVGHGSDGYYEEWLRQQEAAHYEKLAREEAEYLEALERERWEKNSS